jgi:hypothetical protein
MEMEQRRTAVDISERFSPATRGFIRRISDVRYYFGFVFYFTPFPVSLYRMGEVLFPMT